jgi:mono/diheme cytochrome c family protein
MRFKIAVAILVVLSASAAVLLAISNCTSQQSPEMTGPEMIARGKYLVDFGGCNDCHTPKIMTAQGPMPDSSRLLMGHPATEELPPLPKDIIGVGPDKWITAANQHLSAWYGPWGVSFALNLTPDMATGTGSWTEAAFIRAMRTGKHLGAGRQILPPMPWYDLSILTDDDLKSVFAYLRSIPAIQNEVPLPIPPMQ